MGFVVEMAETLFLVTVSEDLTFERSYPFKVKLEQEVGEPAGRDLVVVFRDVNYVCSSALGTLVHFFNTVRDHGGWVWIVTSNANVRRIFDVIHLSRLVTFVDHVDEAIEESLERRGDKMLHD